MIEFMSNIVEMLIELASIYILINCKYQMSFKYSHIPYKSFIPWVCIWSFGIQAIGGRNPIKIKSSTPKYIIRKTLRLEFGLPIP